MPDSLGTLTPTVLVDNPKRVHYGDEDPVTGNIAVRYDPSKAYAVTGPPLFGPLKIMVTLQGFTSEVPLFQKTITIYDGPFTCPSGETRKFPFEIDFPADIPCTYRSIGSYAASSQTTTALPPSTTSNDAGFGEWLYDASIEYRLTINVAMEGLKIKIHKPAPIQGIYGSYEEDRGPSIRYEQPRLPGLVEDRQKPVWSTIQVSNEHLLGELDRPSGFRQKAKGRALAVFNHDHFPKYTFDWIWAGGENLYLTRPATFTLRITPKENECTAPVAPEIHLKSCIVSIEAVTNVRADEQTFSRPESEGRRLTQLRSIVDEGTFSRANNWTKTVTTEPILGMPSTFDFVNVSRRYCIQAKFTFLLAGTEKQASAIYPVILHPPLQCDDAEDLFAAGSSSRAMDMAQMAATLSRHEDAPLAYDKVE